MVEATAVRAAAAVVRAVEAWVEAVVVAVPVAHQWACPEGAKGVVVWAAKAVAAKVEAVRVEAARVEAAKAVAVRAAAAASQVVRAAVVAVVAVAATAVSTGAAAKAAATAAAWAAAWTVAARAAVRAVLAAVRVVMAAAATMAAPAATVGRWEAAAVARAAGSREEGRVACLAATDRRGARGARAGAVAAAAWAAAGRKEPSTRRTSMLKTRRLGNCCAARSKTLRSRCCSRGGRRCTARGFGFGFEFGLVWVWDWDGGRGGGERIVYYEVGSTAVATYHPQRPATFALLERHPVSSDEHSHTCQRLKRVSSRPAWGLLVRGLSPLWHTSGA